MSEQAITKTMRLTLAELVSGAATAADLGCSVATLCALERRRLIRVETSFNALAFPRKALAYITEDGRRMAGRR